MTLRSSLWVLVALALLVASCTSSIDTQPPDIAPSTSSSAISATTTSTQPVPTSTTTTLDPVVVDIQTAVALAVESPEAAVAPGVLEGVDLEAGLPDGAIVTPVEGMLVVSGDTAEVLVDVELPDGRSDRFVVVMINVGGEWLVEYTVLVS